MWPSLCYSSKLMRFFTMHSVLMVVSKNLLLVTSQENDTISTENHDGNNVTQRMVNYCTTPNGDTAYCVSLKNCQKLMDQLRNPNATEFLRNSSCGPAGGDQSNPLVCCGKHSNFHKPSASNPFPKTCGKQGLQIESKILGGNQTDLTEFPWLARLICKNKQETKTFGCTGFLIAAKCVMTAAHCINSANTDILGPISEVHLGEYDTEKTIDCKGNVCADKVQKIKVSQTVFHPEWDMNSPNHHHDIGLIFLKKAATVSPYVRPICIVNVRHRAMEYWVGGWGSTESGNLSQLKMKVAVPAFSLSNCTTLYKKLNVQVIDKQLCAGGELNKDSCAGDSGGPLMMLDKDRWFAVGVVSYGVGCGVKNWPAIYTNITSYITWVKSTMLQHNKSKIKPDTADTSATTRRVPISFPQTTTLSPGRPDYEYDYQNCGAQITNRILGGEPSDYGEYPWLGRLLRRDSQGEMIFTCTGSLITDRVVLTTAHCLVSPDIVHVGELYGVVFGEHETKCTPNLSRCLRNKKTVVVADSVAHLGYKTNSTNHDNDIGLIFLRDRISFTNYIAPICLLEQYGYESIEYHVAGWGRTESGSTSDVKLKATLQSFVWLQCQQKYRAVGIELTVRQMCAGGIEGIDSCQGDSGGPLMVQQGMKWYVAGVVSFGIQCGRKGLPGVYVNVPSYINWIKSTIRQKVR